MTVMMMGLALFGGMTGITFAQGDYTVNSAFSSETFGTNAGKTSGIGVGGAGTDQKGGFIGVVKNFINWVLGILSLITLVLLLWGGFQMVTAAGDDNKYQAGFKILKQAAIGLAFIALAWFMVSIIFWIISGTGAGANPNGPQG